MKRWALIVAGLYCLIILVLTVPVCAAAFKGVTTRQDLADLFGSWVYWIWLAVMVLGQFILLLVPVRIADRRPVSRGSIVPTILVSGLMMAGMAAGGLCAITEFIFKDKIPDITWWIVGLMLLTWVVWTLIFVRMGPATPPEDVVARQCRILLKGSILELLVAVPTHIVARHRDYCCAGIMTFIGIVTGLSVMLFSFGPAVFFLFVARWRRLHPSKG